MIGSVPCDTGGIGWPTSRGPPTVDKGGRVKYTFPDGSTKVSELKTGEALLRPPVTHADEALDDVEAILTEIKQ